MEFLNVADDTEDVVSAIQHMHRNLSHTEDFEFISKDGQHFSSHQLILAIHSSVLADMIYGPNSCRSITIKDVDNCAIQNLIRHCYAENLVFESVFDVIETKIIADKFQIFELSKICVERLSSIDVNISNLISVLKTAIEFNNIDKEFECLSLISEHKEEVFASETFKAIKFESVLEIFEKLRVGNFVTEFEFLNSAIKWLERNERRSEAKEELMNKIDVSRISLNEYVDIIVSFPEFFSNIEISDALNLIRFNEHTGDKEKLNKKDAETKLTVISTKDAATQSTGIATKDEETQSTVIGAEDAETQSTVIGTEEAETQSTVIGTEEAETQSTVIRTEEAETQSTVIKTKDAETQPTIIGTQDEETQSTVIVTQTQYASTNTDKIEESFFIEQDDEDKNQQNIQINKEIEGVSVFQFPLKVKFMVKHNWKNGPFKSANTVWTEGRCLDFFHELVYKRTQSRPNISARPQRVKPPDFD